MELGFINFLEYLTRWGHYLFGITWIGLLYYFNFVQGAYMNQATDDAKVDAFTKLVPRALWWFRYGALFTFITGVLLIVFLSFRGAMFYGIWLAALMATLMFLNVWLIIWPNQKIVIASNEAVRDGGGANAEAPGAAAKALLASRTNTLFSAPMLFLMGSAHLGLTQESMVALIVGLVIIAAIEANGIWGKLMVLTTVKGVITSSMVLTVVMVIVARYL